MKLRALIALSLFAACGQPTLNGTTGVLEATPQSVDFGTLAEGASTERSITLRNVGNSPVGVAMVNPVGDQASDFALVGTLFSTVAPGQSATVTVRFTPQGPGARVARLVFATDSRLAPELSIPLGGFGEACATRCDAPPTCMTGGRCLSGQCRYEPVPGCGVDAGEPDAGAPDAGESDAGAPDAGEPDAGAPDAGEPDAGAPDAGGRGAGPFRVAPFALGQVHTCAVTRDAGVMCWGSNSHGQVGDQTTVDRTVPTRVQGLPGPASGVAAGMLHSCAVMANTGELACWGTVGAVQPPSATPVIIPLPGPARDVAGSLFVTCATVGGTGAAAGTAWCWGTNYQRGLVGDGSTMGTVTSPVQLSFDAGVVRLSGGWYHHCALLTDGRVYCWGENGRGQLGDGTTNDSPVPVLVHLDAGAVDISSAQDLSCAQKADGRGSCWGYNGAIVIDQDAGVGAVPNPVDHWLVPEPVRAVAAGTDNVYFALLDGGLACVGGALGCAATGPSQRQNIPGVANPPVVRGMLGFACSGLEDAGLVCWGGNQRGALGNGSTMSSTTPARPLGLQ